MNVKAFYCDDCNRLYVSKVPSIVEIRNGSITARKEVCRKCFRKYDPTAYDSYKTEEEQVPDKIEEITDEVIMALEEDKAGTIEESEEIEEVADTPAIVNPKFGPLSAWQKETINNMHNNGSTPEQIARVVNRKAANIEKWILVNISKTVDKRRKITFSHQTEINDSTVSEEVSEQSDEPTYTHPTLPAGEENWVKGFFFSRCERCGEISTWFMKEYSKSWHCYKCHHANTVKKLRPAAVKCECGCKIVYKTDIMEEVCDVPCKECSAPVAIAYNKKANNYYSINVMY